MTDVSCGQPLPAVVNPLQWQFVPGTAADGTRVFALMLMQGALTVQLQVNAHDAEQLAKGLQQVLTQARSGLILPAGAQRANGSSGG